MLLPFFPRSPHRLARLSSAPLTPFGICVARCDLLCGFRLVPGWLKGLTSRLLDMVAPPPRMAETEE